MSELTRRRFVQGLATAVFGGVAGCTGSANGIRPGDDESSGATSFFVIADFASGIAGDAMTVDNLVPFGQHGHGWEPGPTIQRDILNADAFIYVGKGFQPWADNIVQNIHDDGADVAVIEAWADVELLDISEEHVDHADQHGEDGHEEENDEHDADSDDERDESTKDPHFWLDPVRATQSVRTIASGLSSVDPQSETAFVENADTVVDRLDQMDATFHERLSNRSKDTVLFAGHNSFRYLGHRYDFEIESLTGLAPDDTPSSQDIKRAQELIAEHDIEYVLAPVFESDRAATQLVEETDATGVLPLTPVPSLTSEWRENDWGFVDVMENVNLDSLVRALGAE